MDRAVEEGYVRYVTDAALEAVTGRLAPCSCSWSSAVRRQHVATKAAESAVWGGSAWTGLQPAGVAKARQTWLGKPWSLGFGQADPWGPEGAGLESAEGSLSQLNPDGEQRLPFRGSRRERAATVAWPSAEFADSSSLRRDSSQQRVSPVISPRKELSSSSWNKASSRRQRHSAGPASRGTRCWRACSSRSSRAKSR